LLNANLEQARQREFARAFLVYRTQDGVFQSCEDGFACFGSTPACVATWFASDALVNCSFKGFSVAPAVAVFFAGAAFFAAGFVLVAGFAVFVAIDFLSFSGLENRLRRHTTPCVTAPS
jgi:hypothetical protein